MVRSTAAQAEIDVKDGSRHNLKVEGKHMSGWVTLETKEGLQVLEPEDGEEDEGDKEEIWHLTKRKQVLRPNP